MSLLPSSILLSLSLGVTVTGSGGVSAPESYEEWKKKRLAVKRKAETTETDSDKTPQHLKRCRPEKENPNINIFTNNICSSNSVNVDGGAGALEQAEPDDGGGTGWVLQTGQCRAHVPTRISLGAAG